MITEEDQRFMAQALALAQAQQGRTVPNPSVGCVLVRDGAIVGLGATGDGGRPHAEERALLAAGDATGTTAYVTLEPCGTRSSGAPACSERLIAAGVIRVVCALADRHPNGAGGFARLEEAGVPVLVGVMEAQAQALYAGFFHRVETGLPLAEVNADPTGYDGEFTLLPAETLTDALKRLGAAGLSRVFAKPGSTAAEALRPPAPRGS